MAHKKLHLLGSKSKTFQIHSMTFPAPEINGNKIKVVSQKASLGFHLLTCTQQRRLDNIPKCKKGPLLVSCLNIEFLQYIFGFFLQKMSKFVFQHQLFPAGRRLMKRVFLGSDGCHIDMSVLTQCKLITQYSSGMALSKLHSQYALAAWFYKNCS